MFRKSNFVVTSLLVFVFGFQSMAAAPNSQPYSSHQREELLKVYKILMPHPAVAAFFGFADWPIAEREKIQKEVEFEVTSLPPLEFEGNKIKVVIQGQTHFIEVVDRGSRTFLVDGKLFKLDPTKTIDQLKKELRGDPEKTALSRLFFETAEAQVGEVIAVLLIIAAVASLLKTFVFEPIWKWYHPMETCTAIDRSSDQIQAFSKKDLKNLTSDLQSGTDDLKTVFQKYKENCATETEQNSGGCTAIKLLIQCMSQRSGFIFSDMDRHDTLEQPQFTADQRNKFNQVRADFQKVLDTSPIDLSQPSPLFVNPDSQGNH